MKVIVMFTGSELLTIRGPDNVSLLMQELSGGFVLVSIDDMDRILTQCIEAPTDRATCYEIPVWCFLDDVCLCVSLSPSQTLNGGEA